MTNYTSNSGRASMAFALVVILAICVHLFCFAPVPSLLAEPPKRSVDAAKPDAAQILFVAFYRPNAAPGSSERPRGMMVTRNGMLSSFELQRGDVVRLCKSVDLSSEIEELSRSIHDLNCFEIANEVNAIPPSGHGWVIVVQLDDNRRVRYEWNGAYGQLGADLLRRRDGASMAFIELWWYLRGMIDLLWARSLAGRDCPPDMSIDTRRVVDEFIRRP